MQDAEQCNAPASCGPAMGAHPHARHQQHCFVDQHMKRLVQPVTNGVCSELMGPDPQNLGMTCLTIIRRLCTHLTPFERSMRSRVGPTQLTASCSVSPSMLLL